MIDLYYWPTPNGHKITIFLEEADELFPQAGEQLRAWRRQPEAMEHAQGLRRTLHTIKGSARMAGAMRLGELTVPTWVMAGRHADMSPAGIAPRIARDSTP